MEGFGLRSIYNMYRDPLLDFFQSSVQVHMDFLRSWVGIPKGVGFRTVLIVGLVRNLLNMFFLSVHHTIPGVKIFWII